MKLLLTAVFLPGLALVAGAAILPDAIGPYQRTGAAQAVVSDRPLWNECGLKEAEAAAYASGSAKSGGSKKLTATAYRLQDSTGALAAFDWQRPADAEPSKVAALAAETANSLWLVHGNYLLVFQGYKPSMPELDAVAAGLRNVDSTPLPTLPGFFPAQGLEPNTGRYILGPVALQRFAPAIPPSTAAFRLGAEAQLGTFRTPKGEMTLAIFSYPTPQIAMQQVEQFQKIPGAMAKRSVSLVAVVVAPPDPDAAERLLASVRYQAQVTRDEYVPTRRDNIGNLITNVFSLIGILLAFALVSGLAVGGFRAILRVIRKGEEPEAMITLHLEGR